MFFLIHLHLLCPSVGLKPLPFKHGLHVVLKHSKCLCIELTMFDPYNIILSQTLNQIQNLLSTFASILWFCGLCVVVVVVVTSVPPGVTDLVVSIILRGDI